MTNTELAVSSFCLLAEVGWKPQPSKFKPYKRCMYALNPPHLNVNGTEAQRNMSDDIFHIADIV